MDAMMKTIFKLRKMVERLYEEGKVKEAACACAELDRAQLLLWESERAQTKTA